MNQLIGKTWATTHDLMKIPTYAWTFVSSSGTGTYETLQYSDGSLSCACQGWTRRVASDGSRTCKHVRAVQLGEANATAKKHGQLGVYPSPIDPYRDAKIKPAKEDKQIPSAYKRKFT